MCYLEESFVLGVTWEIIATRGKNIQQLYSSKVVGYEIYTQKSVFFLYAKDKSTEK